MRKLIQLTFLLLLLRGTAYAGTFQEYEELDKALGKFERDLEYFKLKGGHCSKHGATLAKRLEPALTNIKTIRILLSCFTTGSRCDASQVAEMQKQLANIEDIKNNVLREGSKDFKDLLFVLEKSDNYPLCGDEPVKRLYQARNEFFGVGNSKGFHQSFKNFVGSTQFNVAGSSPTSARR